MSDTIEPVMEDNGSDITTVTSPAKLHAIASAPEDGRRHREIGHAIDNDEDVTVTFLSR